MSLLSFLGYIMCAIVAATITGFFIYNVKCGKMKSVALGAGDYQRTADTSVPALDPDNEYDDFGKVLQTVREEYPKAYSAAGQVY